MPAHDGLLDFYSRRGWTRGRLYAKRLDYADWLRKTVPLACTIYIFCICTAPYPMLRFPASQAYSREEDEDICTNTTQASGLETFPRMIRLRCSLSNGPERLMLLSAALNSPPETEQKQHHAHT